MTKLLVNYFAEGSVNMNFGDKILEAKKKGLTQKELGALLHVSDKVISKWEIKIPECDEIISPFLIIIAIQLLVCNISVLKGIDVDHSRNLNKVTVTR